MTKSFRQRDDLTGLSNPQHPPPCGLHAPGCPFAAKRRVFRKNALLAQAAISEPEWSAQKMAGGPKCARFYDFAFNESVMPQIG